MTENLVKSTLFCKKNKVFFGTGRAARSVPNGAGGEIRTHDLHLGKVALYQLSYARPAIKEAEYNLTRQSVVKWFLPISIDFHPDHA